MRFKKLFLVVLLAMGTLSACSTSNNTDDNASKSVALVTDGKIDDQSFNQAAWKGLKAVSYTHLTLPTNLWV